MATGGLCWRPACPEMCTNVAKLAGSQGKTRVQGSMYLQLAACSRSCKSHCEEGDEVGVQKRTPPWCVRAFSTPQNLSGIVAAAAKVLPAIHASLSRDRSKSVCEGV